MKLAIFALVFAGLCLAQFPVNGRIVDDIDGKPVANAQVGLLGGSAPATVRTDGEGKFAFSVPEGKYKLAAEKAGFLPYPNEVVDVRDGSPRELALVLTKARSITANVVWPDGERPVLVDARVRLANGMRPSDADRLPHPSMDRYILSGLRPGRYVILIDAASTLNRGRTGVPVQFPSPEAVERGEEIDLRFKDTQDLGTITIPEASGVEVSGRFAVTEKIAITNFSGSQKAYPLIDLITPGGITVTRVSGQPDGTFRFPKVAPGTYFLMGNTQIPNYVTFGVQEIQVGAIPVSGLVMALPDEPPVITGSFEIETPEGRVGVGAQALLRFTRPQSGVSDPRPPADGNFSIKVPMNPGGPISGLQFSMRGRIPTDAYIASFTQGQATYTRDPFPVAVNGEPVHVLFKQDGATIRGQVSISGSVPYPPFVVLAPKDRAAELFYRTTSTDSKGSFQLEAIAPGTYDLFAFDREANYAGQQTLRAYQDAAMSVTVAAGESLTVNPKVVRIEK